MRHRDEGAVRIRDWDAKELSMNRIVYIVGAIVIILAILSFFGLR